LQVLTRNQPAKGEFYLNKVLNRSTTAGLSTFFKKPLPGYPVTGLYQWHSAWAQNNLFG